jgi:hypothetical protein
MADLKKFLDQAGVSTLWSRIAEEVAKVDAKAVKNAEDILAHDGRLTAAEGKIEALEKGTYDDTEVRGLIADNVEAIGINTAAIATLNGEADVAGSVKHTATQIAAAKVAEIVANADADFDTLKEIADWILNDTTGAADMANDIKALQDMMVGVDTTVVAEIAGAIDAALKTEGVDKYALAADLTALDGRVQTLENANYQNADQVGAAIDAKITALDLANTYDAKGAAHTAEVNAKAYADGLAGNYEVSGAAAQALADAKAYTDQEAAKHETKGAAANALAEAKLYADGLAANYDAHGSAASALTEAKAYADGLASNYDAAGAAAAAETAAKNYADTEIAKIQALTPAEIDAAIEAAKNA